MHALISALNDIPISYSYNRFFYFLFNGWHSPTYLSSFTYPSPSASPSPSPSLSLSRSLSLALSLGQVLLHLAKQWWNYAYAQSAQSQAGSHTPNMNFSFNFTMLLVFQRKRMREWHGLLGNYPLNLKILVLVSSNIIQHETLLETSMMLRLIYSQTHLKYLDITCFLS